MNSGLGKLLQKSKKAVKEEGVAGFLKKAKNYMIFKIKVRKSEEEMKDVLFINGCTLPHPMRYRVEHQVEQLEAGGFSSDMVLYTELDPEKIKFYRAVVIFRCPITEKVEELIKKAHYFNKKVFFDVDDLVIDKKYTDKIKYIQQMNSNDRAEYDDGVVRMGKTMKMCDYCITTTKALANELQNTIKRYS